MGKHLGNAHFDYHRPSVGCNYYSRPVRNIEAVNFDSTGNWAEFVDNMSTGPRCLGTVEYFDSTVHTTRFAEPGRSDMRRHNYLDCVVLRPLGVALLYSDLVSAAAVH